MEVRTIKLATVRESRCLIHVQWMKAQSHQSRIVIPMFKCTCVFRVHVCMLGGGGGGGSLRLLWLEAQDNDCYRALGSSVPM